MNTNEEIIKKMAQEIIDKIKDGKIFGIQIDINNINHLIVAANLLAYSQKQKEEANRMI